uniref:Homeobox domain-containing protein n=1 Tax=Syphacia muris TaxID=451379 RepID=A0A0N5AE58_9BILA
MYSHKDNLQYPLEMRYSNNIQPTSFPECQMQSPSYQSDFCYPDPCLTSQPDFYCPDPCLTSQPDFYCSDPYIMSSSASLPPFQINNNYTLSNAPTSMYIAQSNRFVSTQQIQQFQTSSTLITNYVTEVEPCIRQQISSPEAAAAYNKKFAICGVLILFLKFSLNVRPRADKNRTVYSMYQRRELENEFLINRFPSCQRRTQLSGRIHLTENQIKIWFQNRYNALENLLRAKERIALKRQASGSAPVP